MKFNGLILAFLAWRADASLNLRVKEPTAEDIDRFHRGLQTGYICVSTAAAGLDTSGTTESKIGFSGNAPAYTNADTNTLLTINDLMTCDVKVFNANGASTQSITMALKAEAVSGSTFSDDTTVGMVGIQTLSCPTTAAATTVGAAVACETNNGKYVVAGSYSNAFISLKGVETGKTGHKTVVSCSCGLGQFTITNTKTNDCFSKDGLVDVLGKGPIAMSELAVGDKVLTTDSIYEPVIGFAHRDKHATREFIQLFVEGKEVPLEMTPKHLVYKSGQHNPVAAQSIIVGDILEGENARVTRISTIKKEGIYAPLTPSGNIMVNGLKASNYVLLQDGSDVAHFSNGMSVGISQHHGIHIFASPFRMLCMSGFSSVCDAEDGMPAWVSTGIQIAAFAEKQNVVVQLGMLAVMLSIFLPVYGFELFFGASGLFALVSVLGIFLGTRLSGVSLKKIKTV